MIKIAALLLLGLISNRAATAEGDKAHLDQILELMGCAREVALDTRPPLLRITCDQAGVLDRLPFFQGANVVNKEVTKGYVNTHPITFTSGLLLQATAIAIPETYRTTQVDALRVDGVITSPDDYGHTVAHAAYTMGFDRRLFVKIDWNTFEFAKLPKVGKRFAFTPWYSAEFAKEQ